MNKEKNKDIENLQRYLPLIRKAGGWTSDKFAKKLGISRQALSKLENADTCNMSQTTYMAIRSLLDYEMNTNPDNVLLRAVVNMCLEDESLSKQKITDEERKNVDAYITGAQKNGLDNKAIIGGVAMLLGVAVGVLVAPSTTEWMEKLFHKE